MARLQAWGDLFFDVFSTSLSFIDLLSDIFVSVQFYQEGERVCFWVSMWIFFVAQCAYVTQFDTTFSHSHDSMCKRAVRSILVFPFAQFVPIVVWLHVTENAWFTKILKTCGLNTTQSSYESGKGDPLQQYLSRKLKEHMGFMIEAVVEAVPQSLLQMAYIVARGKATPLNVFSISSSLLTVCSKGFLFAYSIHPLMVVFGVCCFCADVTGIFATVSFLTMPSTSATITYSMFGIEMTNLASYVWLVKELILFVAMAVVGLFSWGMACSESPTDMSWSKHIFQLFLLFGAGIVFFIPVAIFLEGLKLFCIPLLVFGEQLQLQRGYPIVNRGVWDFVRGISTRTGAAELLEKPKHWFHLPDFDRKIRALNLVAAQGRLDECSGSCQAADWSRRYYGARCRLAQNVKRSCLEKGTRGNEQEGIKYLWIQYKNVFMSEIEVAMVEQTYKAWVVAVLVTATFAFLAPVYAVGMYVFFLLVILITGCLLYNFLRFLLQVRYAVHEGSYFRSTNLSALNPVIDTYCVWRGQELTYRYLCSYELYALPIPQFPVPEMPLGYCPVAWENNGACARRKCPKRVTHVLPDSARDLPFEYRKIKQLNLQAEKKNAKFEEYNNNNKKNKEKKKTSFSRMRIFNMFDRLWRRTSEVDTDKTLFRLCSGPRLPREIALIILEYYYDPYQIVYRAGRSRANNHHKVAPCLIPPVPLKLECS